MLHAERLTRRIRLGVAASIERIEAIGLAAAATNGVIEPPRAESAQRQSGRPVPTTSNLAFLTRHQKKGLWRLLATG